MDRRGFLRRALGAVPLGALPLAAPLVGCTPPAGRPGTLRVGLLANLTHAPALTARLERPGLRIETRTFRAGPRVCEALLGNAIDLGISGPGPILSMHARHGGNPLVLVSGMTSGGASLVVRPEVRGPEDLAGRRVAAPQLGSTPDVSLRTWLARHGLSPREHGGDVAIDALAAADILAQMRRGALAGAWVSEPWATRLVVELGATRLVDERALWPDGRFPTALVVVRRPFYEARRADVDAAVATLATQIERARTDASVKLAAFAELRRLTGKALPKAVMDEAWARLEFTRDPLAIALARMAEDARALGYVPRVDVQALLA